MHHIVRSAAIVAASVLTLSLASGAAMAGSAQEEANRKTVLAFYEKGLNQKDADAALAYVGDRYVQHNPNAADGPDGFRKFIGFLREKFPNSHSEIKRSFVGWRLRHPARSRRSRARQQGQRDRRHLQAGERQGRRTLGRRAGHPGNSREQQHDVLRD